MRKVLLVLLPYLLWCSIVYAQDSITVQESVGIDTVQAAKQYRYWERGYYDSIPRIDPPASTAQPFQNMIVKYQHKDFEYVESISDKLTIWGSIRSWIKNFLKDLFPDINLNPGNWFYNLLGIAGAGLVIYLLYKFFLSGRQLIRDPQEEDSTEQESIEFVERNLLDVDIHSYIKNALNDKNYALAIRYQQLLNIQLLATKNFISWNQTKTNVELMAEIPHADLQQEFKKCTDLFNYVWFGDFTLTPSKFEEIINQFREFQRRWS